MQNSNSLFIIQIQISTFSVIYTHSNCVIYCYCFIFKYKCRALWDKGLGAIKLTNYQVHNCAKGRGTYVYKGHTLSYKSQLNVVQIFKTLSADID